MTPDSKAITFFRSAFEAFQRAERDMKITVDRFYSIGGYSIRLRFAGSALVPLMTPALEHLATTHHGSPSLTICLWDSESTGTVMPAPPWSLEDYSARGEVQAHDDDRYFAACHKGSGALSILDRSAGSALWWIRRASLVPFYETGAPLLTILHWWMLGRGLQVVHAGAVGTPEAGVLLVGRGGSGKSTASLACLGSELLYVGDDYCLVRTASDPFVFSLYNSGKLDPDQIKKFPDLTSAANNTDRIATEKVLFLLSRHYSSKIIRGFPIRAIFVLRITGRPETTLSAISAGAALRAVAPNTLFQLPHAGRSTFHEIAALSKQVPCYQLNVGSELQGIPEVILNFLSDG
ncbi:MAG: serine kinase [Deltaproteobacteria bacterium]|nr:serine kinase [Deltaproteobacteria bacterium]